ncbi:hypothetical protein P5673_016506 [Acropora cervicornis]|uniref:Uncharacterized protein n=1 Tax=Acropora cervicornis TaxID=6130 RepID=A0AAD9QGA3_ACRCE|nr:hypothetical protein P5673_016506 [Acropora cervicornis]
MTVVIKSQTQARQDKLRNVLACTAKQFGKKRGRKRRKENKGSFAPSPINPPEMSGLVFCRLQAHPSEHQLKVKN